MEIHSFKFSTQTFSLDRNERIKCDTHSVFALKYAEFGFDKAFSDTPIAVSATNECFQFMIKWKAEMEIGF